MASLPAPAPSRDRSIFPAGRERSAGRYRSSRAMAVGVLEPVASPPAPAAPISIFFTERDSGSVTDGGTTTGRGSGTRGVPACPGTWPSLAIACIHRFRDRAHGRGGRLRRSAPGGRNRLRWKGHGGRSGCRGADRRIVDSGIVGSDIVGRRIDSRCIPGRGIVGRRGSCRPLLDIRLHDGRQPPGDGRGGRIVARRFFRPRRRRRPSMPPAVAAGRHQQKGEEQKRRHPLADSRVYW